VKPGQPRKDRFRESIVWDINPKRTALLVIDMQNAFVDPDGLLYVPATKGAVPKINDLARTCRDHGISVMWVRTQHRPDGLDLGHLFAFSPDQAGGPAMGYSEGAKGAELYPQLEVKEEDLVVTKKRYSAFINGSSDLDRILRYMDINTVIIVGVATNVCCGATAMDAMMLDYKVIFVSDANAAFGETTPEGYGAGMVQEATLITLRACFATVCTTDELIEEITKLPTE
jgi:ureidoacrylate peracid hydrolase